MASGMRSCGTRQSIGQNELEEIMGLFARPLKKLRVSSRQWQIM